MDWVLGHSDGLHINPIEFVTAEVPSDVQLVWKKEKGMPDYNFGKNYLEYKWMEDRFWHYETKIFIEKRDNYTPFIIFNGIDYRYTIFIDGDILSDGEGMFTPVEINLKNYVGKTVSVRAVIHPIPKLAGASESRDQAAHSVKPAVSYGWDWHPRLVPSGLYNDVDFVYLPDKRIEEVDFTYELNDNLDKLDFTAKITTTSSSGSITLRLFDADGTTVCENSISISEHNKININLDNPKLWWCVGQGEQYLYSFTVSLYSDNGQLLDSKRRKVGFRRTKLVMNADNWWPDVFPVTQARFPMTMELNGRRIFCKGTNFVPIDIFYSKMNHKEYEANLKCALECNMNMLRLWGGGLVNKECFFDLCDEMGLMVWQEFPLACNKYPDDDHYLEVLNKESISIIKRLKSHPCVVIWCGGNELFNSWSKMTNQSLPLRLLDKNCYEYDRHTPFLMTSPLYGIGHGCYLAMSTPERESITDFVERFRTAYTEFGTGAPAPFDYIKKYIPESELYTVEPGTSWEDHHAINAWSMQETWFRPSEIEAYYGKPTTNDSKLALEQTIENGLELQGESYKGLFEEARRKWPETSMAINWCFNEPWPCFANNSLIMYPTVKRPAYYVVRNALRDTMFSAKLHHLRLRRGETIEIEIYALNDKPKELEGASYTLYAMLDDIKIDIGQGTLDSFKPNSSKALEKFTFTVPSNAPDKFTLYLDSTDESYSSSYIMYCPFGDCN